MLDDIIKKLSDTYTSDLLSAEEEKEMVTTQLREERKFLKLILSEEGEAFNEFSPRTRKDGDGKIAETRKKIEDLEKRQEDLALSIELSKQKLSDMKAAKEELADLRERHNSPKNTSASENMPSAAGETISLNSDESSGSDASTSELLQKSSDSPLTDDNLIFRLNNIISFLPADPMRAKVELQDIVDDF